MLFIAASIIFFTCILAGWGGLCVRWLRFETDNPCLYPFLGMFAAGALFTAVSLYFPINEAASAIFILAGLGGMPWWARAIRDWHSRCPKESRAVFLALAFGCAALVAARFAYAEWTHFSFDTEAYHFQSVRWLNEYGTPPGLANLFVNLGVNSTWLVLSAVMDNFLWDNRTPWIMSPLFFFCVITYLSYNILFASEKTVRLFCASLFLFVFCPVLLRGRPSLYYDTPALWISILVFAECLKQGESGWNMTPGRGAVIISLAVLAFCIKPLAAMGIPLASAAVFYGMKKKQLALRQVCGAFAPGLAAGIAWTLRNCLLSGYPAFPAPLFPLPTDWTAPREAVVWIYDAIRGFARTPTSDYSLSLHNWNWLVPWLKKNLGSSRAVLAAWLPLLAGIFLWLKTFRQRARGTPVFFCAWAALCLLYWFFTAPAIRFASAFFQIFFALGLAFAWADRLSAWEASCASFMRRKRFRRAACACYLLVLLAAGLVLFNFSASKRSLFYLQEMPPGRALSSRELDASVTPPLLVFIPRDGSLCGNSPLPCTSSFDPRLRLRAAGKLGEGFYIAADSKLE